MPNTRRSSSATGSAVTAGDSAGQTGTVTEGKQGITNKDDKSNVSPPKKVQLHVNTYILDCVLCDKMNRELYF